LCGQCEAAVWRAEFADIFLFGDAVRELDLRIWRSERVKWYLGGINWEIIVLYSVVE
jgi:hypothetical protein